MTLLTREQILDAKDIETEDVEVPEWGGTVRVKAMTGAERDEYESYMMDTSGSEVKMNLKGMKVRLVALTVVDEKGKRMFEVTDIEALSTKSASALDRVFQVASRLSGMTVAAVEELQGN